MHASDDQFAHMLLSSYGPLQGHRSTSTGVALGGRNALPAPESPACELEGELYGGVE